jgi:hypothetical protein
MENPHAEFIDTPSHGFYSHEADTQKASARDDLKQCNSQQDWGDEDACFIRSSN